MATSPRQRTNTVDIHLIPSRNKTLTELMAPNHSCMDKAKPTSTLPIQETAQARPEEMFTAARNPWGSTTVSKCKAASTTITMESAEGSGHHCAAVDRLLFLKAFIRCVTSSTSLQRPCSAHTTTLLNIRLISISLQALVTTAMIFS